MTSNKNVPMSRIRTTTDGPLWYLAYGSNMKASSMKGRNIKPLATKTVRVPTHYFTFDVFGIPYSEPCYASIERFPDGRRENLRLTHNRVCFDVPPLCGVAHLLSPADFHRLLVTEGSGVVYNLIELEAQELMEQRRDPGMSLTVYTLKAKWPQRPNGTPSARYLNLFLEGAKESGLPTEYISYLESFPKYHKIEGKERTYGQLIFDLGWRPFLKRLVRLTTWRVDEDGNCPFWIAVLIVWLYQLMWSYHDYVHVPIFGRGDGGKLLWKRTQ
ncbi:hypothetical protein BKA66DRAFT_471065 [Pyrenochaeta sp. MPI-SDFR-AT-0127]|nr:hypothetical protein BKA66DRAFT_471065 [Pyrenochaeta sp. MPI-SDFR-AT-0127]